MTAITVLIAEDHAVVREGLRMLLEAGDEFAVIGEASNGRQAVRLARRLKPAVVIMDVAMPLLNGADAARQIARHSPEIRVLALSAHRDPEYLARMVAAGARGYLVKESSGRMLRHAVREVAAGRPYFCEEIVRSSRLGVGRGGEGPLTPREGEVLQRVAEGAANKQMASEMGISIKTVEKHRQQLMDKLGIHDTAGLTRHAIATGVIHASLP